MLAWICMAIPASAESSGETDRSDTPLSGDYSSLFKSPESRDSLNHSRIIYQQTIPEADGTTPDGLTIRYLRNRRALVGQGCMVNKLATSVGVASAVQDLAHITDLNLDNYATIAKGADVSLALKPIVSVRDTRNYYGKGTPAGFTIVARSGTSVLSLDVIKAMAVAFFRDGNFVGSAPVREGQNASGVNLSLIQIGGSENASMNLTVVAPAEFDEIMLCDAGGVNVSVVETLFIQYAFVGEPEQLILNNDYTADGVQHEGGITVFNRQTSRQLTIESAKCNGTDVETDILGIDYKRFILNPDESAVIGAVLTLGGCSAEIHLADKTMDEEDEEVFPAGSEIGFNIGCDGLLKLGVGDNIEIILYGKEKKNRDYVKLQTLSVGGGVLGVDVAKFGNRKDFSVKAPVAFSGAKIFFGKTLSVDLGSTNAYYAYVKSAPDIPHYCDFRTPSKVYLQPDASKHQIEYNPTLKNVRWEIVSGPDGHTATVDSNGLVSGISKKGSYVIKGTCTGEGHDKDCTATVTIQNDQFQHNADGQTDGGCGEPLTNYLGDSQAEYAPSTEIHDTSGSLISISDLKNPENITDADHGNYAEYVGGVQLVSDLCITGAKALGDNLIKAGDEACRLGFVVEEAADAVTAGVLQFLQIRCYYKGNRVYNKPVEESNAVKVGLIGSEKTTKVRYSIEVPEGFLVDEIQLWASGVANINLSKLKIYYPFKEDTNSTCATILGCDGRMISRSASVDTSQYGLVAAGVYINDISNFIDEDYNSYMTIGAIADVTGTTEITVNLGETINPGQQVGIIMDAKTFLANINVGNWLTITTYNTPQSAASPARARASEDQTPVDTFTDWNVAKANVAGFGDKNVLYITPSQPFNEMHLQVAGVLKATDQMHLYGLCTRGDADKDGIPDCMDAYYDAPVISGTATPAEDLRKDLQVTLDGTLARVSCPTGIGRVIVFDINGQLFDSVDGKGNSAVSVELSPGIRILLIELADGSVYSLKTAL